MPFFPNAHDFTINGAQMNDIAGDYTANHTTNTTSNTDSNNVYVSSSVSKGNVETQNASIGNGDDNAITFGRNIGAFSAGIPAAITPELLQLVGQVLPGGIPGFRMSATTQSFVIVPQNVTPPSIVVSTSLGMLRGIPEDSWTPEMLNALETFMKTIQGALQKQPQKAARLET